MVVVRENTEDAYAGLGGIFKKGTPDEVAIGEMIFTRKGVERVIRYAFELARARAGEARKQAHARRQGERDPRAWTSGRARSRRSAASTPTSSATTPTSTRPACGW